MTFFEADVKITVDAKGVPSQLAKVKSAATSCARHVQQAFSRMATRVLASIKKMAKYAVLAFAAMGAAAVKWASDVKESEHLFEFAMGEAAAATRDWSEELATALKRNQYDIRRTTATLNVLLTTMGITSGEAAKMSQNLVEFSYDMAALRNMRPEEVFEKLKSGIVGFSRPMRALGISTIDTQVKMYALAHGIGTVGEELTETEKMMARYGIMMQTARRIQGYAISEIDFAASVYKSLTAQIRILGAEIGEKLLPAVTDVGIAMRDWLIEDREEIVRWAQVVGAHIIYIKDLIVTFIKFIYTDWDAGIKFMADVVELAFDKIAARVKLKLAEAFLDTEQFFRDIAAAEAKGWKDAAKKAAGLMFETPEQTKARLAKPRKPGFGGMTPEEYYGPGGPGYMEKPVDKAAELVTQLDKAGRQTSVLRVETEKTAETFKELIPKALVADWDKAGETLKATLKDIREPYVEPWWVKAKAAYGEAMRAEAVAIEKVDTVTVSLTKAQESARSTMARMLKDMEHEYEIRGLIDDERERAIEMTRFETEAIIAYGEGTKEATDAVNEYKAALDRLIEGRRDFSAFTQELGQWVRDATNFWKNLGRVAKGALDGMVDTMATALLKGEDLWKSFAQTIVFELTQMIIKMQMAQALSWAFPGLFPVPGGGGGGGGPPPGTRIQNVPGTISATYGSAQYGGEVTKTGLIMAHKGEVFSGVQGGPINITITYKGDERPVVTEKHFDPKRELLSMVMDAAEHEPKFRRSIARAAKS